MHDRDRKQIAKSWINNRWALQFGMLTGNYFKHMQPINYIKNYYGERTGFFFAFLTFYTIWLVIPIIPGIVLFVYQMVLVG